MVRSGHRLAARSDPARPPRPDEPIPIPLRQSRRVSALSEEPEKHPHRGLVVPLGRLALGGRHLLTVDVKKRSQRERLGRGLLLAVRLRLCEPGGELVRLPLGPRPVAVPQRPIQPSSVLSPLDLEQAGFGIGETPGPGSGPIRRRCNCADLVSCVPSFDSSRLMDCGYEREQGRIRCERRVKNNARRRAGEEVVRIPWNRPLHWARFRREGMQPGQARRATGPAGEDRVDAWRRAEAQLWENAEDRRWLEFWRLESRARKEWAELHKRQEDTRRTLDRESRTVLGRLRIWRTGRSLRELAGAVRGREDLVEGWREDLDRHHKGERAALGKAHADSARKIERQVREAYRSGLRDAKRRERPTLPDLVDRDVERAAREMKERERTWERERGRSITRIPPRPPQPPGPERGGGGFER